MLNVEIIGLYDPKQGLMTEVVERLRRIPAEEDVIILMSDKVLNELRMIAEELDTSYMLEDCVSAHEVEHLRFYHYAHFWIAKTYISKALPLYAIVAMKTGNEEKKVFKNEKLNHIIIFDLM